MKGFIGGYGYHKINPQCFTAETLVATSIGLTCIENIRPGDYVYAKNEETGEQEYMPVLEIYENEIDVTYTVTIDGKSIETTAGHPFYTTDEGWIGADELETGDNVELSDGRSGTVESVERNEYDEPITIYNFNVMDYHTYYVGEIEVLVHNAKGLCGGASEIAEQRVYNPSPKHDPKSGWGSQNPIPDVDTGQALLDNAYSSSKNKQLYNIYEEELIKFQPDSVDGWHAYSVSNTSKEVPTDVLRNMFNDGIISKTQYKKFTKNK